MIGDLPVVEMLSREDQEGLASVASLYQKAFPSAERKPWHILSADLTRSSYQLLGVRFEGEFAGFAAVYSPPRGSVRLIEYMAVEPHLRGRGIGSALFNAVARAGAGEPLLLEVEAGEADGTATRRKAFYRRLGCRQIGTVRYRMPCVSTTPPPPMHLLVYGIATRQLHKNALSAWLMDIFKNVYQVAHPRDSVHSMLQGEPEVIPLV
jgi:GNAT superfamily N-acetyltransferase